MKKKFYIMIKALIHKTIIKSANTTSSYLAHQPVAPKNIDKFKKR